MQPIGGTAAPLSRRLTGGIARRTEDTSDLIANQGAKKGILGSGVCPVPGFVPTMLVTSAQVRKCSTAPDGVWLACDRVCSCRVRSSTRRRSSVLGQVECPLDLDLLVECRMAV